jgi:hypothetical protein
LKKRKNAKKKRSIDKCIYSSTTTINYTLYPKI